MPMFGCITNPYKNILREIEIIGKLGFDFVEIAVEEPATTPQVLLTKREQLCNLSKKYKIPLAVIHVPINSMLDTSYEEIREAWINLNEEIIKISNVLGVQKLNLHACYQHFGLLMKKYRKQILDTSIASLRKLTQVAKKYGIKIVIENPDNVRDLKYIISEIPDLGINLDVGHVFLFGGLTNVKKIIKTFRDEIAHCHMHDNNGKQDKHLPIGKGIIDYRKVVKWLKEINYENTITLEVFTTHAKVIDEKINIKNKLQAKASMEKIKKFWK